MKLYQKKLSPPVKAFQWFPELGEVGGVVKSKTYGESNFPVNPAIKQFLQSSNVYVINTNHGPVVVRSGDWIITSPQDGETYPCEAEKFATLYEEVGA